MTLDRTGGSALLRAAVRRWLREMLWSGKPQHLHFHHLPWTDRPWRLLADPAAAPRGRRFRRGISWTRLMASMLLHENCFRNTVEQLPRVLLLLHGGGGEYD